ncbi:MAG: hypothetical protein J1E29_00470 [Duncaniella sp.]|nr:hypothetical protein [Duncaniella sp.]
MNIDELKAQWRSIDVNPDTAGAREVEQRVARRRVQSLGGKYYSLCMRMVAVSCLGILAVSSLAKSAPLLAGLSIAFFVLMGGLQLWQAFYVKELDFGSLSVREAIMKVCRLERMRYAKRAVGMILAVPLLVYMLATFANLFGRYMLFGGLAGLIVGIFCALIVNHNANSILRRMKEQLGEEADI